MNEKLTGKFIVLDGPDGCDTIIRKSTVII